MADGTRGSRAVALRELVVHLRRLLAVAVLVVVLLLLGATGLSVSEGVGFWYAFQWALDTAATVGGFPHPHTTAGQVIEVALVLVGVGTLFYALAVVADLFVAGHLSDLLASRRIQKTIDSLTGHHIICGFGRVGRQVARDLIAAQARCVVIDSDPRHRELADGLGLSFVEGDATDDEVLRAGGVERAQSIIACADSDTNNVFITLTARGLRDDLTIVARAAVEDTEKKLKRAGADRVISPYKTSGTVMARLALHRQLSGVVDVDAQYRIEEIEVGEASEGVGSTIGAVGGGLTIVGLRRGAEFQPQPPSEMPLHALDVVVAMGAPEALERLEGLLGSPGTELEFAL